MLLRGFSSFSPVEIYGWRIATMAISPGGSRKRAHLFSGSQSKFLVLCHRSKRSWNTPRTGGKCVQAWNVYVEIKIKVHSFSVFALVCAHSCGHRFIELKHATCRGKVNILGQWKTKITFPLCYSFMLVSSAVQCNHFRRFANCLPCEAPLELSLSPPKIKCGRSLSHLFCWTAYFSNGNNTCREFNMSQQSYKLGSSSPQNVMVHKSSQGDNSAL